MRNRLLAPFIHQLASAELAFHDDDSRSDVACLALELAGDFAALEPWQVLLERAATDSGINASWAGREVPISGGSCVVFRVKETIIKFVLKVGHS